MALIQCPECGNNVSDRAAACPRCARPLGPPPLPTKDVQTIQQTGKKFKAGEVIGAAIMLLGLGACWIAASTTGNPAFAIVLLVAGLATVLVSRTLAWWEHG